MLIQRNSDGSYTASCKRPQAPLRAIVAEGVSHRDAMLSCAEIIHDQRSEEYAMWESMSHFAEAGYGEGRG